MTYQTMTAALARAAIIPLVLMLVSGAQVLWWMFDRSPPFKVLSVEPSAVRAGETVALIADVYRDTARRCDSTISRYILDAKGFRHDIGSSSFFPAESIDLLERRSPRRLMVRLNTPGDLPPGKSELVSSLLYVCNPVHRIYPIVVMTSLPFEVIK